MSVRHNIAPQGFVFECALVAVAAIAGYFVGVSPVSRLTFGTHYGQSALVAGVWGLVASLPPLVALVASLRLGWRPLRGVRAFVQRRVMVLFRGSSTLELFALSAAAGVGEELLFRGVAQDGIAQYVGGQSAMLVGLIGASLLFGLAHAVSPAYAILAFGMGLYLGALYEFTGNLVAPIVAHAAYDFAAFLLLRRRGRFACG